LLGIKTIFYNSRLFTSVTFAVTKYTVMKRIKTYDVPHKGIRNALSQLLLLAGKTDYSEPLQIKDLYDLGMDVFKILTIHAADENEVTLAHLELHCPGCSKHDMEDHEIIHREQDKLEQLISKIHSGSLAGLDMAEDGAEFYLSFSEFQGRYLQHMAEEERITQPLLWKHFTDEELSMHRVEIMSKNPPAMLLTWFRFVIPAQAYAERIGLLSTFKKLAPAAFFEEGMRTVARVIPEVEYEMLCKGLGA